MSIRTLCRPLAQAIAIHIPNNRGPRAIVSFSEKPNQAYLAHLSEDALSLGFKISRDHLFAQPFEKVVDLLKKYPQDRKLTPEDYLQDPAAWAIISVDSSSLSASYSAEYVRCAHDLVASAWWAARNSSSDAMTAHAEIPSEKRKAIQNIAQERFNAINKQYKAFFIDAFGRDRFPYSPVAERAVRELDLHGNTLLKIVTLLQKNSGIRSLLMDDGTTFLASAD